MAAKDSEWPRYEVFQQQRAGGSYQNVGSVHAPDAELALQNARDVFVRRPRTVSLWVVPAGEVLARTRAELAEDSGWQQPPPPPPGATEGTFHVFQKKNQRRSMNYVTRVGEVQAPTASHALCRAWEQYGGDAVYVWWIVPAAAITTSTPADADSMFRPAEDKEYRLPGAYHTRTLMREATEEKSADGSR